MLKLFYGSDGIPEDERNAYAGIVIHVLAFAAVYGALIAALCAYLRG